MKKLIALLLCCLILAGCTQPAAPTEPTNPSETATERSTEAPTNADAETVTEPPATQPVTEPATDAPTEPETDPQPTTINVYFGNENYDGLVSAKVEVDEITPNTLVDKLIEAGVLTDDIGIWSMQIDGTCLRLVFSPTFGDLIQSQGSAGEYVIMGSVVNTFLDAFDAETVYITVGNDILESGHQVYDFELSRYD